MTDGAEEEEKETRTFCTMPSQVNCFATYTWYDNSWSESDDSQFIERVTESGVTVMAYAFDENLFQHIESS